MAEFKSGDKVLCCTLTRVLGRGGFGQVWDAESSTYGRVALKLVQLDKAAPEERAFLIYRQVQHPNILRLYHAQKWEEYFVIVMELGSGSLQDRFCDFHMKGVSYPLAELLSEMDQVGSALDYLNAKIHVVGGKTSRIIHRDIKPANLVYVGGCVKVADPGLSKANAETGAPQTFFAGTMVFMAPEVLRGETSHSQDLYSLAATYFFLRSGGCSPVPWSSLPELMQNKMAGILDLDQVRNAERRVLEKALHKDPALRFDSCAELVGSLKLATDSASSVIPVVDRVEPQGHVLQTTVSVPNELGSPFCGASTTASVRDVQQNLTRTTSETPVEQIATPIENQPLSTDTTSMPTIEPRLTTLSPTPRNVHRQ